MGILYILHFNKFNKVKNVIWIVFLSGLLLGALKLINAFCQCGASFHLVEQCLCLHSPALCEETLSRVVFVQQTKQEKQQSNFTSWGIISAFKDKASHPGNPDTKPGNNGKKKYPPPLKTPSRASHYCHSYTIHFYFASIPASQKGLPPLLQCISFFHLCLPWHNLRLHQPP